MYNGVRFLVTTEFTGVVDHKQGTPPENVSKDVEDYFHFGGTLFVLSVHFTQGVKDYKCGVTLGNYGLHPPDSPVLHYVKPAWGKVGVGEPYPLRNLDAAVEEVSKALAPDHLGLKDKIYDALFSLCVPLAKQALALGDSVHDLHGEKRFTSLWFTREDNETWTWHKAPDKPLNVGPL